MTRVRVKTSYVNVDLMSCIYSEEYSHQTRWAINDPCLIRATCALLCYSRPDYLIVDKPIRLCILFTNYLSNECTLTADSEAASYLHYMSQI